MSFIMITILYILLMFIKIIIAQQLAECSFLFLTTPLIYNFFLKEANLITKSLKYLFFWNFVCIL